MKTSSTGPVSLLRTLWALGTGSLIGASLAAMLASFLVPLPPRLLWLLLLASGASFFIHMKLNKMESN